MLMGMARWRASFEGAWREGKNAAVLGIKRQEAGGLDHTQVK